MIIRIYYFLRRKFLGRSIPNSQRAVFNEDKKDGPNQHDLDAIIEGYRVIKKKIFPKKDLPKEVREVLDDLIDKIENCDSNNGKREAMIEQYFGMLKGIDAERFKLGEYATYATFRRSEMEGAKIIGRYNVRRS